MANYPYMPYQPPVWSGYAQTGFNMPQNGTQTPVQGFSVPGSVSTPTAQNAAQPPFICVPVTSRAEAEAQRVEAFGPAMIMPDPGHGAIYYKKFNQATALADFIEFRAVETQEEKQPINVPQIDFGPIAGAIGAFNGRFDAIGEKLDSIASRLDSTYQKEDSVVDETESKTTTSKKVGGKK